MTRSQITLSLDTDLIGRQVAQLAAAAALLPKRRAQRFYRKALRLLHRLRCDEVPGHASRPAGGTCHFRVQVRVVGMDELIAAALRAGKLKGCHGGPHAK